MTTTPITTVHLHHALASVAGQIAGDALATTGMDPEEFERAAAPALVAMLHRDRGQSAGHVAAGTFSLGFTLGVLAARNADAEERPG